MAFCAVSQCLEFCPKKLRTSPFVWQDSVRSNMYSAVGCIGKSAPLPGGQCTVIDIQWLVAFLEMLSVLVYWCGGICILIMNPLTDLHEWLTLFSFYFVKNHPTM